MVFDFDLETIQIDVYHYHLWLWKSEYYRRRMSIFWVVYWSNKIQGRSLARSSVNCLETILSTSCPLLLWNDVCQVVMTFAFHFYSINSLRYKILVS